jgi:parvulin-like peptidyl-prolyl isomerase
MGKFYIDDGEPRYEVKEVEKIVQVLVPHEVIKEVPVEIIKTVELIKEVPYEVIKEIPVEVEKIVEIIKEVPVEIIKEIEVPVEVIKTVEVTKIVHDIENVLKEKKNVEELKNKIKLYQIALAAMILISVIVGVL